MKRLVTSCAAFGAGLMWTSFALAAQPLLAAPPTPQADASERGTMAAYFEDEKKEEAPADHRRRPPICGCTAPDCGCEASCSEPACGCEVGCCSSCGCGAATAHSASTTAGPSTAAATTATLARLQSHLTPCCTDITYGGWLAMGWYSNNDPLSTTNNDLLSFWDNPNDVNIDQAWMYVEKLAKTRRLLLGLWLPR